MEAGKVILVNEQRGFHCLPAVEDTFRRLIVVVNSEDTFFSLPIIFSALAVLLPSFKLSRRKW